MMMRKDSQKRTSMALLSFVLVFPLLLTGCWNNRDLTEMNFLAGLGLDMTDDGKILLTVQVVEPGAIQPATSGSGQGGGEQLKPVFIASSEGETVFEAVRGILSTIDKKLFLSSAQVLILGEKLSRDGLEKVIDFFQRDHETNYLMIILAAKGVTPGEILEMQTDIDSIPAIYIKETVENAISRGTVEKTTLIDLIKDMDCTGRQPSVGQISMAGEKRVRAEGLAVFRDERLVGWLDPYETRGYLFASDKVTSAIVNVPADEGRIAMEIFRSKGKIGVAFENGEPSTLTVKVKVNANVGEYDARGRLDSPDNLYILEKKLGEEIKKEIAMALEKAQKEYCSDIFGFGLYVHKHHPLYWKNAEKDWKKIFSKLPADIQVDAKIRRTGIIKSPVMKDD